MAGKRHAMRSFEAWPRPWTLQRLVRVSRYNVRVRPSRERIDRALGDWLRGAGRRGIVSAWLFGSVAEDRAHRESDVDIAVLLDRSRYSTAKSRFETRLRLIGDLSSALGRQVDVIVLNDAPPQFARRILTTGRPLVVADADADHAFLRLVLSRAADLEPFLRRMRRIKLAALA
jgi:predicted nucleotidyltransferase